MKLANASGALLAASAAVMLLSSGIVVSNVNADEAKVHCVGVNTCKGTSACKTGSSACKGQNSCKGQGFLEMTKAECDAAGGKVEG